MKRNILYLIVFLGLLGFAAWLWLDKDGGGSNTIEGAERYAFTVPDTGSIDKIIIRDKSPAEIILERKGGKWVLNGEHRARKDAMETLLETLHRMEMRNFIPKRMQQTVMKRMAVHGKEVEIYQNGELRKTMYVGTETPDEMATYMMLKGSDQPFAVHIPGFNGFLSIRFFTQDYLWRSREIFTLNPMEINKVSVTYPDSSAHNFTLEIPENGPATLKAEGISENLPAPDRARLNLFLSAFKSLKYEGMIIPSDPIYARRDSLLASTPIFVLEVSTRDGKSSSLSGYRIRPRSDFYDPEARIPDFDQDRMHGFIDNSQMVLLQYASLAPVLVPYQYFLTEGFVKK